MYIMSISQKFNKKLKWNIDILITKFKTYGYMNTIALECDHLINNTIFQVFKYLHVKGWYVMGSAGN